MNIDYKWPRKNSTNVQHAILTGIKDKEKVYSSKDTLNVGIAMIIIYFITLLYVYGSAIVKNSGSKNIMEFMTFIKKKIRPKTLLEINTLSSSFEKSDYIGTTVLIIIFLALLQGVFANQNIYSNDPKRAPIIAFNYIVIICWLLFMFIHPSKQVGNTLKISYAHAFLAFCVLASLIINSLMIVFLYRDYYEGSDLDILSNISYALISLSIAAGLIMLLNGIFYKFPKIYKFTYVLVAYSELACLIMFGIFMVLFIQYPPLPNDKLVCTMTD